MAAQTNSEDRFVHETVNRQVEQIAKLEASQEHMATQADIEIARAALWKTLKSALLWRLVYAMMI